MRLDFFARYTNHIDHLAPVWMQFPKEDRGDFYVTEKTAEYALHELGNVNVFDGDLPMSDNPIIVSSHGDILRAQRGGRKKIIHIEHGIGHGFGSAAYPDGKGGARDSVSLFLAPNEYTAQRMRTVRDTRVEVVGTPKMDKFAGGFQPRERPSNPVVAIGFHWGDRHSQPPESGSAFEAYESILPTLKKRYTLIGYAHPLAKEFLQGVYSREGIEFVEDFRDVMARADVLINDLSSALYEFLVTGKPVIVLNAAWFRRDVHFGIRFWDYSDIGIQVERADSLPAIIDLTLAEYETIRIQQRQKAVEDLYPYLGKSTERAISVLLDYMDGLA